MRKKLFNQGFAFFGIGILAGAFYREFTKFMNFEGVTSMSVVHTHLIATGALVSLIFCAILKAYDIKETKQLNTAWTLYFIGVVGNVVLMFTRGMFEVMSIDMSNAINMSISGIAGIVHTLLTIGILWFLNIIRKQIN